MSLSNALTQHLNTSDLVPAAGLIGGRWITQAHDEKARFDVTNPADGSILASLPSMEEPDTLAAIDAAHSAFAPWSAKTGKERAAILRRWFDLIVKNQTDLARLIVLEMGKPLTEAMGEVNYAASFIEWFAEEAKRMNGEVITPHLPDRRLLAWRQPLGVVATITPWNFPLAMLTRKAGPALAAGCTVVAKPASQTPLSAIAITALAVQAGVPDGVLNLVVGHRSAQIGSVLCQDTRVRGLSFTGSTQIGRALLRQCAESVKKMSMELGGHAPFIVFADADLEAAVQGALIAKYRNGGQTCVCANRIYVHESVMDAFSQKFAAATSRLHVAQGFADGANVGPLISPQAFDKVREHIRDAVACGATILTGGQPHELGGLFHQPTVLGGVTEEMRIYHEETFGPVAPLITFQSTDEVIARANNTEMGLAAYFYTQNLARAWRVAERLESGLVGVNSGLIATEVAPFGGVKQSGLGREGSHHGMDEFTEWKYVCMALGSS